MKPPGLSWMQAPQTLRLEGLFFLLLVAGYLALIWALAPFVTTDGPAHVYNSLLMSELISKGVSSPLAAYFSLNPNPSNWLDHLLLAGMAKLTGPLVANQLLLSGLVLSFCFGYRHLLKRVNPSGRWLSYLAFPLGLGFFFFMGFFNFLLAVAGWMWLLPAALTMITSQERPSPKVWAWMAIGLTMMAVAQLFVWAMAGALLAIWHLTQWNRQPRGEWWRRTWLWAAIALPGLFLLFWYSQMPSAEAAPSAWTSLGTKAEMLWKGLLMKGISPGKEGLFARWAMIALLLPLVVQGWGLTKWKASGLPWLLAVGFFLALFALSPDHIGVGSFLPYRVLLLLMIVLAVAGCIYLPNWVALLGWGMSVYASFAFGLFYLEHHRPHTAYANQVLRAAEFLEPGDIVLPIHLSQVPILDHVSGLAGWKKQVVILDNYEIGSGIFPVAAHQLFPCENKPLPCGARDSFGWASCGGGPFRPTAVLVLGQLPGKPSDCEEPAAWLQDEGFREVHRSGEANVVLWRRD